MNGYLLWQVNPEWFGWLHYMHDKQGPQSDKGAPPSLPPPPSARPLLLRIAACPLSPSDAVPVAVRFRVHKAVEDEA